MKVLRCMALGCIGVGQKYAPPCRSHVSTKAVFGILLCAGSHFALLGHLNDEMCCRQSTWTGGLWHHYTGGKHTTKQRPAGRSAWAEHTLGIHNLQISDTFTRWLLFVTLGVCHMPGYHWISKLKTPLAKSFKKSTLVY